jgi:hypothetical protein
MHGNVTRKLTPCVAILNKKNYFFSFTKSEGVTGSVWGEGWYQWEEIEKGYGRVNMV